MAEVKKSAQSKLNISEDVIVTVARLAALEVKGVAGLDGEITKMSKLRNNGPITVGVIGDVAALDIKIKTLYFSGASTTGRERTTSRAIWKYRSIKSTRSSPRFTSTTRTITGSSLS